MAASPSPFRRPSSMHLALFAGFMAIVATLVAVSLSPRHQMKDDADMQRRLDTLAIMEAVYRYSIDHDGTLPDGIPLNRPAVICQEDVDAHRCRDSLHGVDLRVLMPKYLSSIPRDSSVSRSGTGTRYTISHDDDGRLTVRAPAALSVGGVSAVR